MRCILILLAMTTLPPALAADRLQDWTAGEAGIYTHAREGAVRVGRVAADGMLQFEWPEGPSSRQTLAATFPTCREDGVAMAEPGDVAFLPTSLIVARGEGVDEELGALHLATSKEVVAWRTSFGQDSAAEGAWLQYVHVSSVAKVEAECRTHTYTGEGDDSYEQVTVYKVDFQPGWNLMRNAITGLHAAPSGKRHPSRIVIGVADASSSDATWYFEPY